MRNWIERRIFVLLTLPAMLIGAAVRLTHCGYQVGVRFVDHWIDRI